jgi:hypothetical protein
MRLVSNVKRLEGAAAARAVAPESIGIVWSKDEARVDAMELREGEYIAVDVAMRSCPGGGVEYWTVSERVTRDVGDLGVFYHVDGGGDAVRVGRVVAIDTDMLRYELDDDHVERQYLRPAAPGYF